MNSKQRDPVDLGMKIQVDATAMQKLWLWTGLAQGEVSALGLVDEIRNEDTGAIVTLKVTDFFLVKQTCSEADTDLDPEAIAQLMIELEASGIDTSRLRCWAHSHGSMGAFWSGTDNETIVGLANGEWLLSLVVDKKRETMMRLDQFHPVHLYLEDVVWEVSYPAVEGLEEQCRKEFKAKVTEGYQAIKLTKLSTTEELHRQEQLPQLGIMPDDLDEDLWWQGVDPDDLEEHQPF